jgi:NADPH:quinone reductase-like Zn-dependent oxidoreductase
MVNPTVSNVSIASHPRRFAPPVQAESKMMGRMAATSHRTMHGIVVRAYGSPVDLRLAEIPIPSAHDDSVLVRVRAASVNPLDWHVVRGLPYLVRVSEGLVRPKRTTPGADVAGIVEAVGANVTRFRPGDAVFGTCGGAFAEFARAKEKNLVRKPDDVTFEQAAAIPVAGCTALQALRDKGRLQPGQRVLVTGAGGGVGTFAVQIAKALGAAHVTGVCSTGKVDLVRSIGADEAIDYTREDAFDGSRRFDVILDIAGSRPIRAVRRALTPHGVLVIVGGESQGRVIGPLARSLRAPLLTGFVGQTLRSMLATIRAEDLQFLADAAQAGTITPAVERTYPLHEAPAAIAFVEQGHAAGKVVITV